MNKRIFLSFLFFNYFTLCQCFGQKQEDSKVFFGGEIEDFRLGREINDLYFINEKGEEIRPMLYINGYKVPPLDSGFYTVCFVLKREKICFSQLNSYILSNSGLGFYVYTKPFKGPYQYLANEQPNSIKTMFLLRYSNMIQTIFIKRRFRP